MTSFSPAIVLKQTNIFVVLFDKEKSLTIESDRNNTRKKILKINNYYIMILKQYEM